MSEAKLEKKMYKLTEKGKMELEKWLHDMDNSVETEKDVFALKVLLLKDIPEKVCYSKTN
ncbi:hypothetical protein P7H17_02500 [Paenibacillus larvae]|nr:hypothetical protein [Paenibacillus larvae]MDT2285201.1 hypothetical protein [Paenibacillus larvae]